MISKIHVLPRAICDSQELYDYFARQDVALAKRFNAAVADTLLGIQQAPQLGIRWQASQDQLSNLRWKRIRGFKKHLIFYRFEDN